MPGIEYDEVLKSLGVDESTLVTGDRGTLTTRDQLEHSELDRSLPRLVLAGPDSSADARADLRLQHTIGSGATATVWAAAQPSLRRIVAVKQLRPNRNNASTRSQLLQEARITGALEHPNIVPVHGLGVTQDDSPLLIMKYIEGTPWRSSLDPLYATKDPPPSQRVERQLRIVLAVTSAVHFGHERGVLHRDLKPDNVMLGQQDEVYLVDWGLAVGLTADVDLPLATDVCEVAGTPGYMAPEMAAADGRGFGRRTDVYLLGALLHELVTGARRHAGQTVIEQLASAYRAEPHEYPPWVPIELAEICNRACHRDPSERFEDASAFRKAVEDFLRHRASRALAEEARTRVDQLRGVVAGAPGSQTPPLDAGTWNRWSTEARFGYRQALREWPDNESARHGLQELLELLIARELERDNPRAAAELASELPIPNEAVRAEIVAAENNLSQRSMDSEALAKFRHDRDFRVSVSVRRRMTYLDLVVLVLGVGILFGLRISGLHVPGYPDLLVVTAVVLLVMIRGERKVAAAGDNEVNRKLLGGITRIAAAVVVLFCVCWVAGVDIVHAEALSMLLVSFGAVMLAHTVDTSLRGTALGFFGTCLGVLALPELRGLIIVAGGIVALTAGAVAWRRKIGR